MILNENIIKQIDSLYEECLIKTEQFHTKIDICLVPDDLAQKVLAVTNIDIANHWITIDNYGIIHTLSQHGNPISESKRGQIAIEKEDFLKFINVVLQPDRIVLLENTKRSNLPQIQFEKEIFNKIVIVKEIRTVTSTKKNKVSRLVFHTMYKKAKSNKD